MGIHLYRCTYAGYLLMIVHMSLILVYKGSSFLFGKIVVIPLQSLAVIAE
jgi:hypothetical protein